MFSEEPAAGFHSEPHSDREVLWLTFEQVVRFALVVSFVMEVSWIEILHQRFQLIFRGADLPDGLEGPDTHADGQVQTPGIRVNRNPDTLRLVALLEKVRDAVRLTAEHQHIPPLVLGNPVGALGFLGEEKVAVRLRQFLCQAFPVIHDFPVQKGPVIEPGPLHVAVVELKTEGPYQPQLGAQTDASAANRTGVVGDFRLKKDYIQYFWFHFGNFSLKKTG